MPQYNKPDIHPAHYRLRTLYQIVFRGYWIIYIFLGGNVAAGFLQALTAAGFSSFPTVDQLQHIYFIQLAQTQPQIFWPLLIILVILGIIGPFASHMLNQFSKVEQHEHMSAIAGDVAKQYIAPPTGLFRLVTIKNLNLTDYKQGPNPVKNYFERPIFTEVRQTLHDAINHQGNGLIVVGRPMVGKTRIILEALQREAPDWLLFSWRAGVFTSEQITRAKETFQGKDIVLFLDDLHELARSTEETGRIIDAVHLLQSFTQRLLIVGTSRPGTDEDMTLREFSSLLESLKLNTLLIIPPITDMQERAQFMDFARAIHQKDASLKIEETSFDGTPGSVFLGLDRRVTQLRDPSFPYEAKAILKALALLRAGQITPATEKRVRRVASTLFALSPTNWQQQRDYLVHNEWIAVEKAASPDENLLQILSDAYLDVCLPKAALYPESGQRCADDFPQLAQAFMATPVDTEALFSLSWALRADPLGNKAIRWS